MNERDQQTGRDTPETEFPQKNAVSAEPAPALPGRDDIHANLAAWLAAERLTHETMIRDFAARHGLHLREYGQEGRLILSLESRENSQMEPALVSSIESHYATVHGNIFNNCFFIAIAAEREFGGEVIHTHEGTTKFIGWGNHYMNCLIFPDGSAASMDFTAGKNVECVTLQFNVLLVHAKDIADLLAKVGGLYGGTWTVLPEERKK